MYTSRGFCKIKNRMCRKAGWKSSASELWYFFIRHFAGHRTLAKPHPPLFITHHSFIMPWTEIASVSEFEATDRKYCELSEEVQLGLFKHEEDGKFYAVEIWCSHQKVSLMNGDLEDHELMCPLHGACFDIRTGKHLCLPAVKPIKSYPVKVEDDKIFVDAS